MSATHRPEERTVIDCPKCGKDHYKCKAHNRAGKACGLHPQPHQDVCHLHGGKAPAAKAGAKRRQLEEQAMTVVRKRWQDDGDHPIVDPLAELARVAGEIVAFKDYLRDAVQQLDGILAYWVDKDYVGADGEVLRSEAAEQLRAVVIAYERALDRSVKVLGDMVKLDIAGRALRIREEQADTLVAVLRAAMGRMVGPVLMSTEMRKALDGFLADELEQVVMPEPVVIPAELIEAPEPLNMLGSTLRPGESITISRPDPTPRHPWEQA